MRRELPVSLLTKEEIAEYKAGDYAFDGACLPGIYKHSNFERFSIGVFQWEAKSSRKGLKRGKVILRIRGITEAPTEVYARAQFYVDGMKKVKDTDNG